MKPSYKLISTVIAALTLFTVLSFKVFAATEAPVVIQCLGCDDSNAASRLRVQVNEIRNCHLDREFDECAALPTVAIAFDSQSNYLKAFDYDAARGELTPQKIDASLATLIKEGHKISAALSQRAHAIASKTSQIFASADGYNDWINAETGLEVPQHCANSNDYFAVMSIASGESRNNLQATLNQALRETRFAPDTSAISKFRFSRNSLTTWGSNDEVVHFLRDGFIQPGQVTFNFQVEPSAEPSVVTFTVTLSGLSAKSSLVEHATYISGSSWAVLTDLALRPANVSACSEAALDQLFRSYQDDRACRKIYFDTSGKPILHIGQTCQQPTANNDIKRPDTLNL